MNDDRYLDLLVEDLARVESRLFELDSRTTRVIQHYFFLFGAVGLASTQVPAAGATLSVFWGCWLLYAQQLDRYTMRLEVIARDLERRANAILVSGGQAPLYVYRSRLAHLNTNLPDRVLYALPHAIAAILQITASAVGSVLVARHLTPWALIPYVPIVAAILFALAIPIRSRPDSERHMESALATSSLDGETPRYGERVWWVGTARHRAASADERVRIRATRGVQNSERSSS